MATTAHSGVPAKAPSRKDLSGPALRTFFRIADAWDLKEAEQMKLLGLDSRSTFQTWKRGAVAAIPKDALERISYVMGIYKGLKMLLPRTANEWVRKPNEAPLFAGRPAIERMASGSSEEHTSELQSLMSNPYAV